MRLSLIFLRISTNRVSFTLRVKKSVLFSGFPDLEDEFSYLHGDVAVVFQHLAETLVPFLQVEYLRRHGGGLETGRCLPASFGLQTLGGLTPPIQAAWKKNEKSAIYLQHPSRKQLVV